MKIASIISFYLIFCFCAKADQNDLRLNKLFSLLLVSNNTAEINIITSDIWNIWMETNDPLIDEDFNQGLKKMLSGNLKSSITFFTQVIQKNPNFAEGWNKRATVYYMIGDFEASINDINQTLKLEPRHFGAMDGLASILINFNELKKAIFVYDQMLEIFPKNSAIAKKRSYILKKLSQSI